MKQQRALVTGIAGQDGAYLARLLIDKGYEVWGAYRRSSSQPDTRLKYLGVEGVRLVTIDLLEDSNIRSVLRISKPDEIYNLAAQSFVGDSFALPVYTGDVNGLGVARLLAAIKDECPATKFYQASTSEMYGNAVWPQDEGTSFQPRSPYAAAKLYAHWMTINYREAYGLDARCGILFNHESPIRGVEFVTRKITSTLARIVSGSDEVLLLGNLESKRDWGFAGDYVRGMWLTMQADPAEYVFSSGGFHSVREFVELAAAAIGMKMTWRGNRGFNGERLIVDSSPEFYRPTEVDALRGDSTKARHELKWEPKVKFHALVSMMVLADLERLRTST